MNSEFASFIDEYNRFAKKGNMDVISLFHIEKRMTEIYGVDRVNIYDKVEILFPTIGSFLNSKKCKIYRKGEQMLTDKTTVCHICNKSFIYNCSSFIDKGRMIHMTCRDNRNRRSVQGQIDNILWDNDICRICNKSCYDENPVYIDGDFFHKSCCVQKTLYSLSGYYCYLCQNEITKTKNVFEYCTKNEQMFHVNCAKTTNKNVKYKKVRVKLGLNKCTICGYYVANDKYVHTDCQNRLKKMVK